MILFSITCKDVYLIVVSFFILLMLTTRNNVSYLKKLSLLGSIVIFIVFLLQNVIFSNQFTWQFSSSLEWTNLQLLQSWGTNFHQDSISHFFIGLSIVLTIICYLISWDNIKFLNKEFILLIYFSLIVLIGVFSTSDILIFYILFESSLIPLFLIIGIWIFWY